MEIPTTEKHCGQPSTTCSCFSGSSIFVREALSTVIQTYFEAAARSGATNVYSGE
jgi:hypothetical protein